MSKFACEVVRLNIEAHPNADALELAAIGDYRAIVPKGQFQTGDLAVYIPEQAIVPDWLIKKMGLEGRLSGSGKNRVKAIKLRGVLSQGLVYGCEFDERIDGMHHWNVLKFEDNGTLEDCISVKEGEDVAEFLGIKKFEPTIPLHMQGRIAGVDLDITVTYDFENLKRVPDMFDEGESVVITEKIHGTLCMIGWLPESMRDDKHYSGRGFVSSKGLGAKGWLIDPNDTSNLYVQTAQQIWPRIAETIGTGFPYPVILFGEIFGEGIQDLHYGAKTPQFRAFDMYVGVRSNGCFWPHNEVEALCKKAGIETVPNLYVGPFSMGVVKALTDGNTTVDDKTVQIREGIVIKNAYSGNHSRYGRRIAKSVSEAYLLRKGNVTEFQ